MSFGTRRNASSGSPYEARIGISRGVRIGSIVAVSGTAPLDSVGRTMALGDASAQARRCLEIVRNALEQLGTDLSAVIRTRVLLTRIENWEKVAKVHGEFFSQIRPANTVVQVSRFIDPQWMVEIEADAVVDSTAT